MWSENLLVSKRRGKEKDQTGKKTNSEDREQVSSEVIYAGSDNIGGGGNTGGEVSHVLDHVDLGGFPCGEGLADCEH